MSNIIGSLTDTQLAVIVSFGIMLAITLIYSVLNCGDDK